MRGLVLRGTQPYVNYAEIGVTERVEPLPETRVAGGGIINIPMPSGISSLDPTQRTTAELGRCCPRFSRRSRRKGAGSDRAMSRGELPRGRRRPPLFLPPSRRRAVPRRPAIDGRDVRYSFERLLQCPASDRESFTSIRGAKALFKGQAKDLEGFHIQSATEFTIELDEPVAFFPALLSHIIKRPSSPKVENHHRGAPCLGRHWAVPYRAFEPGRRLELERNTSYWRAGYPRSEGSCFTSGCRRGTS